MGWYQDGQLARKIYDETYELEKKEPSYPDGDETSVGQAAYGQVQWAIEFKGEDAAKLADGDYYTTLYQAALDALTEEGWREYIEYLDFRNKTTLSTKWGEAEPLIEPYRTRITEALAEWEAWVKETEEKE